MSRRKTLFSTLLVAALVLTLAPAFTLAQVGPTLSGDAIVLVNSTSSAFADFGHLIQPYLDHFGIPYTVLDIATDPVAADIDENALIIVGHRQLDPTDTYLDPTEEANIAAAVSAGTGLVNFDNDLSVGGSTPRYQFIQDIFDFGYLSPSTGAGVTFTSETGGGFQINCWEDDHQDPVLTTFTNASLFVDTDGYWDEFLWLGHRDYPGVFAGIPEATDGSLETFHCFGDVPNGTYDVIANLYHSRNWRYYWGYTAADPQADSYDVTTGPSGDFAEFEIDTITITDESLNIYMNYGEDLGGTAFPYFGWSWIRLVPTSAPPPVMHYITERHAAGETIGTGSMTLAGITLSAEATALAMTGSQPFLTVAEHGLGRAVQWGSYNWMSHSVKGPVYGLDDLVWRSIVWAARKPFVMQGLPPFLTMRVDDESGPFGWIEIANEFDIKPWAGLFYYNVDATEAAQLSDLVNAGQATAAVHAKTGSFFYYDHGTGDFSDAEIEANFAHATAWHATYDIPISKFVLPHYYEFGTNVFQGLSDWGVEFVGTMMDPGNGYGAPWIMNGPYRLYETGGSSSGRPVYYADFMSVPGRPEFDGQFFNCVTEIRDDAGYEWYPSNDVAGSIGRGTRQSKRALDSMALATLFTHGYYTHGITPDNWRAILQGITDNLAGYEPIYVTLDHACQYVRAMHTSNIAASTYDPDERRVTAEMSGETDMPTMFYLFTEQGGDIQQLLINVPIFSGAATVDYTLAGPLDHILVSPASVTVATGGTQQFTAQGYDADDNPIPNLPFTWSVSGGGTIDGSGLFIAGLTPGTYEVEASFGGVSGSASVEVVAPALDHFTFEPIASPQYVDAPFQVTITARDISGNPLAGYFGTAALADSTGTLAPAATGSFGGGVWTGEVTVGQVAHGVTLTASDGDASGTSEPFEVLPMPMFYQVSSPAYEHPEDEAFPVTVTAYEGETINLWEDDHQDPVLATTTDWTYLETTPGEWTEFHYVAGGRPFPSVMAAHDEYELYGLPPMHFYASGIPNGEYEVIANLYESAPMRYFYGFTPGNPFAHYVDTPGGAPGTQHREYSLGTVAITDGTFNLYAQDADILGGTYPIFGWAWVRLVPVESETRINLWEDDHQDPVLPTTTNAAELTGTPGQWTEFYYSTRPFPSVMAAHDEYELYGLPLMHFYASGLPNGEYEAFANLYDNAPMRYFYGFTAGTALDNYVDAAGGASGTQHREYSLGMVSITDGTFDLYVQDADILGGTYPIFGWAWVRLESAGLLMGSSSPTMLFDGDGNGIFGEPGDNVKALVDGSLTIMARDTTPGAGIVISATDSAARSGYNVYTILSTNDPPTAVDDSAITPEDTPVTVDVAANDTDPDGNLDLATVAILIAPEHGTLTNNGGGSFTYTPGENYYGADGFEYEVCDTEGLCDTASVDITVEPVNDPPVADDDEYGATEDTPLVVDAPGVLANDSDVDEDLLSVDSYTAPGHGSLTLNADGSFTYTPDADYCGADSAGYTAGDGNGGSDTATITFDVACVNDAPVAAVSLDAQTVQYSDGIVEVVFTVTDVDSAGEDITGVAAGVPDDLVLSGKTCTNAGAGTSCTWTLSGTAGVAAGSYGITFAASDGDLGGTAQTTVVVIQENAKVRFDGENPVSVQVAEDGGDSGAFLLTVQIREAYDPVLGEEPQGEPRAFPGDIGLADLSMALAPVGPGNPVSGTCMPGTTSGSGYDARLQVTCSFDGVPVNTYVVDAIVGGDYYAGRNEDVLTIYDPSLGFATGGGWFYWPGTMDKTNFGFTMKYNKKGTSVKGSLLLIRHTGDDEIYRVKSNALEGLALGVTSDFGWASFSGKSTYLQPGWLDPVGNYDFIVYIEDRNEPGSGTDRFWIEVQDKDDNVVPDLSMPRDATGNAIEIWGGNIVVPH